MLSFARIRPARPLLVAACAVGLVFLAPPHRPAQTHSDVTTVGGIAAGLASVAGTLFTWGFGAPLQASILIHTGALWAADRCGSPCKYRASCDIATLEPIVPPPAPSIVADSLIAPADIGAANALLQDIAGVIGAMRAFDASLDRLYSAIDLENAAAANLQRAHIMGNIIPFLQARTMSADLNIQQIMGGITDVAMSSAQVGAFVADVNANGFPPDEVAIFDLFGATDCERQSALMVLNTPDFGLQPNYSLALDGLASASQLMQLTVPFVQSFDLFPVDVQPVPSPCDPSAPVLTAPATASPGTSFTATGTADPSVVYVIAFSLDDGPLGPIPLLGCNSLDLGVFFTIVGSGITDPLGGFSSLPILVPPAAPSGLMGHLQAVTIGSFGPIGDVERSNPVTTSVP